jgi:hypothetical protein
MLLLDSERASTGDDIVQQHPNLLLAAESSMLIEKVDNALLILPISKELAESCSQIESTVVIV